MRGLCVLLVCVGLVGCVGADAVQCADGRVCPDSTVCDDVHALCVTSAQTTACDGLVEADRCSAGDLAGICDQGVCIPGCGDGVQDGEQCDDGNFASHDGCSSACVLETASWQEIEAGWSPRSRHGAAFMTGLGKLVVFGGTDDVSITDEHWERTAGNQWQPLDITRPSARLNPAMAYDEQHQIVVLFGGRTVTTFLGDTWIYNGTTWSQVTGTAPSARWGAGLAYAGGGKVVLFGGYDATGPRDDTWEFDGTTWTEKTVSGPPARARHSMAWAAFPLQTQRVVLFGGIVGVNAANDTWEYTSGGGWTQVTGTMPFPRYATAMAYSPVRKSVVLFGGFPNIGSVPMSDTWEYDGTEWTSVVSPLNPNGRSDATLTPDPSGTRLVGGAAGDGALADVWVLAGPGWGPASSPGVDDTRGDHELVYNAKTGDTLSIAGYREPGPLNDTFRFDGTRWSDTNEKLQMTTAIGPNGASTMYTTRYRFASTYDAAHERVVVFGGRTSGGYLVTGTQQLTAAGWSTVGGTQPPARFGGTMAYADVTGQVVLFGGRGGTDATTAGTTPLGDTWVLDGGTWSERAITGPPAQNRPTMAYDPTTERIVLFSENGSTWALTTSGWDELSFAGEGPSPRTNASVAYSPELRRIVLYGGATTEGEILSDMWQLTPDGWQTITIAGNLPPPRSDPKLAAHRRRRELLIHGGSSASGRRLQDTWAFQFRSDTPDEVCTNAVDDDGDKRVDLDDPDCAL